MMNSNVGRACVFLAIWTPVYLPAKASWLPCNPLLSPYPGKTKQKKAGLLLPSPTSKVNQMDLAKWRLTTLVPVRKSSSFSLDSGVCIRSGLPQAMVEIPGSSANGSWSQTAAKVGPLDTPSRFNGQRPTMEKCQTVWNGWCKSSIDP